MGRLIDADDFYTKVENDTDLCAEMEKYGIEALKKYLDLQPTAYDVDEVVEDLKKCYGIVSSCSLDYANGLRDAYERAIEIVKGGGIYG